MDTQPLDALLAEVGGARPAVLDIIEGLRHDMEQVDLLPETRIEVGELLVVYEVRERMLVQLSSQLNQARVTVLELLEHGYPDLPEREISDANYDDLDQNRHTIVAAQGQFKRRVVTTEGTSTVSEEEPIQ